MGKEIAEKIAEHQGKPKLPGLSKKEKLRYKEELKALAAEHVPTVVETLAKIVTAKDVPASAKVAAGSAILDRFAGRPVKDDDRHTEQSQLERMGEAELLAFICEASVNFQRKLGLPSQRLSSQPRGEFISIAI